MVENLATYSRCVARMKANWPAFFQRRRARLAEQDRYGAAAERVTENILEDLFTSVLDWSLADVNHQVDHADLVLTEHSVKLLVLEAKRPGALAWNRRAVGAALDQARRYADRQKVRCLGVSDGIMLYAASVEHGGLCDRVFVSLEAAEPDESLWWLSVHGIYRPRTNAQEAALQLLPEPPKAEPAAGAIDGALLHPKYGVPARCFAYVGRADDPRTWKLPYRQADGTTDVARLPKAIQAILSNYRGVRVSGIPEPDIPEVLVTLARAAARLGRMPHQTGAPAAVYRQLAEALEQLGRLGKVESAN